MSARALLFNAQAGDGDSAVVGWNGGMGSLVASGGFGGGTLTIKVADSSGTYISLGTDAVLTAAGVVNFLLPPGFTIRGTLAGASGATLTLALVGP